MINANSALMVHDCLEDVTVRNHCKWDAIFLTNGAFRDKVLSDAQGNTVSRVAAAECKVCSLSTMMERATSMYSMSWRDGESGEEL